ARVPSARALLIGDGEERAALEARAAALGVAARLRITGALTDVIGVLAAADVLAAPSRNEGMGRVLVEAMAIGLPVVGTRVGVLLLGENFLARVDYSLPPFRALTRVSRGERTVGQDPARYLARVAEMKARLPHVLLIPGIEVVPHYHWTGSPFALDMTLHDVQ